MPAFVYLENQTVTIDGKEIHFTISFGGSFFALVDSEQLDIGPINAKTVPAYTTLGMKILKEVNEKIPVKHPELDIRILEMKTAPTMAAILNGEIDAAIIANQPTENQIQGDTLYYEQFFGYVAKNDPVFKKDMIRTADISDEHLWLLDEGHCFRDQLMRFCQMEKVKLRQAAYRLGSLETFMRMVESGNGVTFIPELATLQLSEDQKKLVRPFAIP